MTVNEEEEIGCIAQWPCNNNNVQHPETAVDIEQIHFISLSSIVSNLEIKSLHIILQDN